MQGGIQGGIQGKGYRLTPAQIETFHRDGFVQLPKLVDEYELAALAAFYQKFLQREIAVQGRDFCDMTGAYDKPIESYDIVNVMLPRKYHAPLRNNIYELRAADVTRQLYDGAFELDYDQMVAKPTRKEQAVFHWHQDQAYWPATSDTRTATFWLAIDRTAMDNGAVQFVRGSHREPELRPHRPLLGDREKNHTMVATIGERDDVVCSDLQPGDVTVHSERTLHGSGGNRSERWRRGYVLAFRSAATVAEERAMGFTHSHNDDARVLADIAARSAARQH